MSLLSWFLGEKPAVDAPGVPIAAVVSEVEAAARALEARAVDLELFAARLADGVRRLGLAPLPAAEVVALTQPPRKKGSGELDEEGWRRLALLARLLEGEALAAVWPKLAPDGDGAPIMKALIHTAASKPRLTISVIRQANARAEELARAALAALRIPIEGETAAVSAAGLERLDYERLLAHAEQAKKDAEARMEALKKMQDAKSPRSRGKW